MDYVLSMAICHPRQTYYGQNDRKEPLYSPLGKNNIFVAVLRQQSATMGVHLLYVPFGRLLSQNGNKNIAFS